MLLDLDNLLLLAVGLRYHVFGDVSFYLLAVAADRANMKILEQKRKYRDKEQRKPLRNAHDVKKRCIAAVIAGIGTCLRHYLFEAAGSIEDKHSKTNSLMPGILYNNTYNEFIPQPRLPQISAFYHRYCSLFASFSCALQRCCPAVYRFLLD